MRKVLLVVILFGFCIGRDALIANPHHKSGKFFNSKQDFFQTGHINEFVLDQGHPFKKPSVFGHATIQQGKLKDLPFSYRGLAFKSSRPMKKPNRITTSKIFFT